MNKIGTLVLTSALVFLASCGHNGEKVSIKDFDWTIQEGIVYGERYLTFNFTNNSDYTIYHFELTLSPNKKMTEKVLNEFYAFFQQEYNKTNAEMDYLKTHDLRLTCSLVAGYDDPLKSGETFKNGRCCYYGYGYMYAMNSEYAKYFEEDMIQYIYLDGGMQYTTYYDFKSQTYYHDEPWEL